MMKKITIGALTGLALIASACSSSQGELKLAEREYNGPVRIELIQEKEFGDSDNYRLEIKDSTNTVIAYMRKEGEGWSEITFENGDVYSLKDKGIKTK
jgi:hypothetical protein